MLINSFSDKSTSLHLYYTVPLTLYRVQVQCFSCHRTNVCVWLMELLTAGSWGFKPSTHHRCFLHSVGTASACLSVSTSQGPEQITGDKVQVLAAAVRRFCLL